MLNSKTPSFTFLDHTADLGIKIHGTDLKNLYEVAGKVLTHLMVGEVPPGKTTPVKISVTGDDLADLMVRWLGEILYLFQGEHLLLTTVCVDTILPSRLEATLETVLFNPKVHEINHEIKAVTYHQIEVADRGDLWESKVIFDV